ncbi:MAG: tRNA threonylcarbamoyladenosine dehydratase [Tibeticola sp.]
MTLPSDDGPDLARRFGGLERLFGVQAAARIRTAHVVVVGIGGVGSWAVEALARSGVGRLTLIDLDHVAESNINRQIHATTASIGQAKVQAMRERIASIHPACVVRGVEEFVTPANWATLCPQDADAVIDACDQVAAKTAMAAWARSAGRCFVTVGAAGGKQEAQRVEVDDLSRVTHDPLLAQLRYRLRREHAAPRGTAALGVDCVFSREPVQPPDPSCAVASDGTLNCHGFGSLVSVTATFGVVAAGRVLQALLRKSAKRG